MDDIIEQNNWSSKNYKNILLRTASLKIFMLFLIYFSLYFTILSHLQSSNIEDRGLVHLIHIAAAGYRQYIAG